MTSTVYQPSLRRIDYLILLGYCTILFGVSLVGGRPLSRHEAVLPQSSREMAVDHDWIVPKSGGRPWLESPPLPQWITVAVTSLAGHGNQVWPYRIAPALMAAGVVLLAAWMASGWLGRGIGLVSGLVMATLSEFTRYAWLAEDEIFLCFLVAACTAAFVRLEFFGGLPAEEQPYRFLGSRPRGMLLFFILLGATNLAKGVLFGMALTMVTIAGYWVANRDWRAVRPFVWCWGWLATFLVAVAWPASALLRYPDAINVWFYDQLGRVSGNYTELNQPAWYYLKHLPEEIAPWTLVALVGLALTARTAFQKKRSPERFLWCWTWFPLAALSIPSGKHHHYLLHSLLPWSVLTAVALAWVRDRMWNLPGWLRNPGWSLPLLGIPGALAIYFVGAQRDWPGLTITLMMAGWIVLCWIFSYGLWHRRAQVATFTLFAVVAAAFCGGHIYAGKHVDRYRFDTAFLKQAGERVPRDRPLLVNAGMGQLEAFHTLFYLDGRGMSLHNLTFLLDPRIHGEEVYVVSYGSDLGELANYGNVQKVLESLHSWRNGREGDPLTLFQLKYHPHTVRRAADVQITPMQAMTYDRGPFLR